MNLRAGVTCAVDVAVRLRRARLRPAELVEVLTVVVVARRLERSLRREPLRAAAERAGVRLGTPPAPIPLLPPFPVWARRRIQLAEAVLRRGPFDDTCLRRSLVIGHRLRRLDPVLVIGVRPAEGGVAAHAWLHVLGRSTDPSAAAYVPFDLAGTDPRLDERVGSDT